MKTNIELNLGYLGKFYAAHEHYPNYINGRDHFHSTQTITGAINNGIKGIEQARRGVRFWKDRVESVPAVINGVEYKDIEIEARYIERSDISEVPYYSLYLKGRRDSFNSYLTDAARKKILGDFTEQLNDFCFENEPILRDMLKNHYIAHEIKKMKEISEGIDEALLLLEAAQ